MGFAPPGSTYRPVRVRVMQGCLVVTVEQSEQGSAER